MFCVSHQPAFRSSGSTARRRRSQTNEGQEGSAPLRPGDSSLLIVSPGDSSMLIVSPGDSPVHQCWLWVQVIHMFTSVDCESRWFTNVVAWHLSMSTTVQARPQRHCEFSHGACFNPRMYIIMLMTSSEQDFFKLLNICFSYQAVRVWRALGTSNRSGTPRTTTASIRSRYTADWPL